MNRPEKKIVEKYIERDSFCPWCYSDKIEIQGPIETDMGIIDQDIRCDSCGAEWRDQYSLTAISWLNDNGEREYSDE